MINIHRRNGSLVFFLRWQILEGKSKLTRVNVLIIIIIIIILKFESRVDPGQDLGHGSRESIWVNPSQHINKSVYYYNFKTRLKNQPEIRPAL
jgi:hypothetical protein